MVGTASESWHGENEGSMASKEKNPPIAIMLTIFCYISFAVLHRVGDGTLSRVTH